MHPLLKVVSSLLFSLPRPTHFGVQYIHNDNSKMPSGEVKTLRYWLDKIYAFQNTWNSFDTWSFAQTNQFAASVSVFPRWFPSVMVFKTHQLWYLCNYLIKPPMCLVTSCHSYTQCQNCLATHIQNIHKLPYVSISHLLPQSENMPWTD